MRRSSSGASHASLPRGGQGGGDDTTAGNGGHGVLGGATAGAGTVEDGSSPLLAASTPQSGRQLHVVSPGDDNEDADLLKAGALRGYASPPTRRMNAFMVTLTGMCAIGGLLFGWDTGVVSAAVLVLRDDYSMTDLQVEFLVSSTVAAAIVSAAVGARLTNVYGRRPVILASSATFVAGALCMGFANGLAMLMVGRITVGIGIGMSSMAGPMYIAECAAPEYRGMLVTVNNLFITGGQFLASIVDGAFANVPHGWRYMLGLSGIPAFVMLVGFLFLPESPRFLVANGKIDEATKVLARSRGTPPQSSVVSREIDSIKATVQARPLPLRRALESRGVQRALLLGCGLQALQQAMGINTVMYYSGTILTLAGIHNRTLAIWLTAVVSFTNFVFTIVGVVAVDRAGRRKLTLSSMLGVVFALVLLGVAFYIGQNDSPAVLSIAASGDVCGTASTCGQCSVLSGCGYCAPFAVIGVAAANSTAGLCLPGTASAPSGAAAAFCNTSAVGSVTHPAWVLNGCPPAFSSWLALIAVLLYLAAFAPGMGPMPWTINAEIFPLHARASCVGITTSVNWTLNFIVSLTFLTLSNAITLYGAFWLYAGIGFLGWMWMVKALPETRGLSLEDITHLFRREGDPPEPEVDEAAALAADAAPLVYGH